MAEAPSVALFWGDDAFLLKLGALKLLAERGFQATEVEGADWRGGELSDLATPSLWGERRALLVTQCEGLSDTGQRELKTYLGGPAPDALCALTLVTRGKGPPPLAKSVQAASGTVRHVALKRQDLPTWVTGRAETRGMKMTRPAAAAVVGSIGEDTAALDQAVEQLWSLPGADDRARRGPGAVQRSRRATRVGPVRPGVVRSAVRGVGHPPSSPRGKG